MDAKLFRLPTKPNFYTEIATANPFDADQRQKYSQIPTHDSRYPGWAAPMADGRLVTNYQNHCSRNVPAGHQYATKEWMTKSAADIISINRKRYAQQTGAIFSFDRSVVPPAAMKVRCGPDNCERIVTGAPGGIGTEREGCQAPELFGTWDAAADGWMPAPQANIGLTHRYEGGRNTPRGQFGPKEMA